MPWLTLRRRPPAVKQAGGKRFFPDGVHLDLELVEERVFDSGLIYACYRTR
jgi:hypothetical protein